MQMINALAKTQHKLDRWSLPLLWQLSDISAICNFWPQFQISGGQLSPLTWPYRAPDSAARYFKAESYQQAVYLETSHANVKIYMVTRAVMTQ